MVMGWMDERINVAFNMENDRVGFLFNNADRNGTGSPKDILLASFNGFFLFPPLLLTAEVVVAVLGETGEAVETGSDGIMIGLNCNSTFKAFSAVRLVPNSNATKS